MRVWVYILLWIINMFCVLNNRNNKVVCTLSYILMGLLFVSNDATYGDAYNYRLDFADEAFGNNWSEFGYELLKSILRYLNVNSYTGLLITIFIFSSLLLLLGLRYLGCSNNAVLAMTMPFIFPTCAVAIRFYIATAIMVFSIKFLHNKKYIPYIICVIMASSFHRIAIINIILIICTSGNAWMFAKVKKLWLKTIFIISLLSIILTYILGRLPFINEIITLVSIVYSSIDNKINAYTGGFTRFGALIFFVLYFMGLYYTYIIRKVIYTKIQKIESIESKLINIHELADLTFYVQLVLSITLPFIVLDLIYYRILIFPFILNAILYGLFMERCKSRRSYFTIKIDKISIFFLAICIFWMIPEIIGINSITIHGLFDASLLGFFK